MKAKIILKLVVMGALITLLGGVLHGHDFLTGVAFGAAIMWIVAAFYFSYKKGGASDSGYDGSYPLGKPVPIPPVRPTPREFSTVSK